MSIAEFFVKNVFKIQKSFKFVVKSMFKAFLV